MALVRTTSGDAAAADRIRAEGSFDLPLTYDRASRLWRLPVVFGFEPEDRAAPYWCAVDFSLPAIILPSGHCTNCAEDGRRFTARYGDDDEDRDTFLWDH